MKAPLRYGTPTTSSGCCSRAPARASSCLTSARVYAPQQPAAIECPATLMAEINPGAPRWHAKARRLSALPSALACSGLARRLARPGSARHRAECQIEPYLDQERRRCAAPLARPPPGSALRTPARHGHAAAGQLPQINQTHRASSGCCASHLPRRTIVQVAVAAQGRPAPLLHSRAPGGHGDRRRALLISSIRDLRAPDGGPSSLHPCRHVPQ